MKKESNIKNKRWLTVLEKYTIYWMLDNYLSLLKPNQEEYKAVKSMLERLKSYK